MKTLIILGRILGPLVLTCGTTEYLLTTLLVSKKKTFSDIPAGLLLPLGASGIIF